MGQHHHHDSSGNLRLAFFLNLGFTILEIIGGFWTNSIAIMSDAVHDLGDSLSLGMAWFLQNKSKQKADSKFTFGYQRYSLLGALINSVVLVLGSVFVVREAVARFFEPETSDAQGMLVFALIGISVNGYAAYKAGGGKTLNERVVSWHLIEDVLGWVAVLIVSIVLLFWDILWLDPALSFLITAYILWNVVKRLKETLTVFLQGRVDSIDLNEIETDLSDIEHVKQLHATRLWSLDGEHNVFSTHLVLENITSYQQIMDVKREVKHRLKRWKLSDSTIETELDKDTCSISNQHRH